MRSEWAASSLAFPLLVKKIRDEAARIRALEGEKLT